MRHALSLLVLWGLAVLGLFWLAPRYADVTRQGEFHFLPEGVDSRLAEGVYRKAFEKDMLRSLLVICVRRTTRPEGLTSADSFEEQDRSRMSDFDFIEHELRPALIDLLNTYATPAEPATGGRGGSRESGGGAGESLAESSVTTFSDRLLGPMLVSQDRQATLVVVELPHDYLDRRSIWLMNRIENLVYHTPEFRSLTPPGLEITISGTAAVGRDLSLSARDSVISTRRVGVVGSLVLLLMMFSRTPLLAGIPLLVVLTALQLSMSCVSLLTTYDWLQAFPSLELYVIVAVFCAGLVSSFLILTAYRDELDQGQPHEQAIATALQRRLGLVTGVVGSLMVCHGALILTSYKKTQQAGLVIPLALLITLVVSVTLTAALLRLLGKWVFWPQIPEEDPGASPGWIAQSSLMKRLADLELAPLLWKRIIALVAAYPTTLWCVAAGVLLPLALVAIVSLPRVSYGLLAELSEESRSVEGSQAVQHHFPVGTLGPTTVLLENESQNFLVEQQVQRIRTLCDRLYEQREQLQLLDVYSSAYPLGMTQVGRDRQRMLEETLKKGSPGLQAARLAGLRARVMKQYVGNQIPLGPHVTRIELVFEQNPFHRDSIERLQACLHALEQELPDLLPGTTTIHALGATASIRDLKRTTDRDLLRTTGLILVAGLLIFWLRLRCLGLAGYVLLMIGLVYLASQGLTYGVFWWFESSDFGGLDWKVRLLTFTFLLALAGPAHLELLGSVQRQRQRLNPVKGVLVALAQTGSRGACVGLLLAGTFFALMTSSLVGMQQLGFALACGLLLDTFLNRTLLVPCYLILLERGIWGRYSGWAGAVGKEFHPPVAPQRPKPIAEPSLYQP